MDKKFKINLDSQENYKYIVLATFIVDKEGMHDTEYTAVRPASKELYLEQGWFEVGSYMGSDVEKLGVKYNVRNLLNRLENARSMFDYYVEQLNNLLEIGKNLSPAEAKALKEIKEKIKLRREKKYE